MTDNTILPFSFPAVGRKKITAAFDGGRLTSDGGVMLLALADRRVGVAEKLSCVFPEWRDPSRIVHSLADMIRAGHACWPRRASIGLAPTWRWAGLPIEPRRLRQS